VLLIHGTGRSSQGQSQLMITSSPLTLHWIQWHLLYKMLQGH